VRVPPSAAREIGPIQLASHIFSESRVYILASKTSSMQSISREELKRALDRHQVALVDARSAEEFLKSHLPGAVNVPAGRAAELAPQLLPDKNALIVTYCVNFTWKLSEQLARELVALGYNNVCNYQEGRQDWMKAGLPLEGTAPYEAINGFHPSESEAEAQDQLRRAV